MLIFCWFFCLTLLLSVNGNDRDGSVYYWTSFISILWCAVFRSVYISAKDAESGLKSITASIYDKTLKITVWSDTRPALTLQPADSKRKRVSNVLLVGLHVYLFCRREWRKQL